MKRAGVLAVDVDQLAAQDCAEFLTGNWRADGQCEISKHCTLTGYSQYGKTQAEHSPEDQAVHTLLIGPKQVQEARDNIKGFQQLEDRLILHGLRTLNLTLKLHSAHALRQGPATAGSSVFSTHRDDEEFNCIDLTASVKLTSDIAGEQPSQMVVEGAPETFSYNEKSGSAAIFFSSLEHASVTPKSQRDHLKMVYFFQVVRTPLIVTLLVPSNEPGSNEPDVVVTSYSIVIIDARTHRYRSSRRRRQALSVAPRRPPPHRPPRRPQLAGGRRPQGLAGGRRPQGLAGGRRPPGPGLAGGRRPPK